MSAPASLELLLTRVLARFRRHRPALPPACASPARLDEGEILQRAGSLLPSQQEQAIQQLGGDERITSGPVAGGIMKSEEAAEVVESAGAHAPDQPTSQPDGAQAGAVESEVA